ncbi:MAG: sugar nucleotide-binding protein [Opitutaceae bacterium]
MILLLGGSGYVGQAFQHFLQDQGIAFTSLSRSSVDYTRREILLSTLRSGKPDFLINCAGYTGKPNVDACEDDKAACLFGNAVLPGIIAEACRETGTPWGQVSSGCIYNHRRADGAGFTETDAPNFSFRTNNCSFYSGTKALGEEILAGDDNCYVWRLRIPFNEVDSPRNYLTKLMRYDRLLKADNSLSQLDEFVRACWECWARRVPAGVYNMTNPGHVTTEEVVDLIRASGVCDKTFSFFDDESEFMQKAARTPRSNCVLDTSKLAATGIRMTEVHQAVEQALKNWRTA